MVTTRPPKTIVKPTALGPVANTDTKLLIYSAYLQSGPSFGTGLGETDRPFAYGAPRLRNGLAQVRHEPLADLEREQSAVVRHQLKQFAGHHCLFPDRTRPVLPPLGGRPYGNAPPTSLVR